MTTARQAYLQEVRRAAKKLHILDGPDLEGRVIRHFEKHVADWIREHGAGLNLSKLADLLATSLGLEFVEVYGEEDLAQLLERIPPAEEPRIVEVIRQLDDQTDAVTFRRQDPVEWERPFMALINCRGHHFFRRFFSKWHELAHRLLDGDQLSFVFRKTLAPDGRHDAAERLVDVVAGALAFHRDIFDDVLTKEIREAGRLTFETVDRVIWQVAPDASFQSTIKACVRRSQNCVFLVRARPAQKKTATGSVDAQWQLRVQDADYSPLAESSGHRFHRNMRVPETSLVFRAYCDVRRRPQAGLETLDTWGNIVGWVDRVRSNLCRGDSQGRRRVGADSPRRVSRLMLPQ
jgi:hypothetical protein